MLGFRVSGFYCFRVSSFREFSRFLVLGIFQGGLFEGVLFLGVLILGIGV